MVAYHSSLFLIAFAITFSIIFLPILSLTEDDHLNGIGFSLEMIHRDSPASPLYNQSESRWQRVSNALQRSHHRMVSHFSRRNSALRAPSPVAESHLIYIGGEYLVNISIGTPPKTFIGIVDTGGDLTWTQCKPCMDCFKQNPPLFDPSSSSTYKPLSCLSKECHLLNEASCSDANFCYYNYTYGDMSYTTGNLSLDTVTLASSTTGKPISIPNTIFGCGHHNGGIFSGIESGIVGLGSGAVSLLSRIGYAVGGKSFSYCLVPTTYEQSDSDPILGAKQGQREISSTIYFGDKVSGHDVVSTPLLSNGSETYYYLELQGISVGADNFKLDADNSQSFKGNIIIDSGTTSTFLPTKLYQSFESAIRKAVHLEVTKDPTGILQLCYKTKSEIEDPIVTFHFNGADVKLKPVNVFVRVREDIVCLSFSPTNDVAIYGNVAQMNFLVGYDLDNKTLSFKSTDQCTW
ncbi:unnamed protein product [Prunus armeniaca]|uniref:Peptidase A1 domain-containing protein n=1 Tax=Prunus armeniaca TaxID=36596 RepID=A0A6J5U1U7_PRUAR|nr:hypothetical protein GBA52_008005 [Prunus armeniaca]CAB4269135.1 unnamed protein product [Prunus armeniaca]